MSDFIVVDNTEENITIQVEEIAAINVFIDESVPNTVIIAQEVAFPVNTNIDGGVAQSVYGGTIPINGGGA